MPEGAYTQRLRRAKKRTLNNLLNVYKIVMPASEPVHYYCPKAKMFVWVELDELTEEKRNELIKFKNDCSTDTIIQVHLYRGKDKKPELEEVK